MAGASAWHAARVSGKSPAEMPLLWVVYVHNSSGVAAISSKDTLRAVSVMDPKAVAGLQVDGRTQALLDHRLRHLPAADAAAALLLRGLMELCIYPPQPHSRGGSGAGSGSGAAGHADGSGDSAAAEAGSLPNPAAEQAAASAAPAAAAADHQHSGMRSGDRLPVSWSCTDEAVLQVAVHC